jgi:class 3 adenylate cyclase
MIRSDQMPQAFRTIIEEELAVFREGRTVQVVKRIPDTTEIPLLKPRLWLKIPDVVCVFVDMKGSTKLSASVHDESTAGAYQLFTSTAVRLFNAFKSPYIDVKGDGAFALFNSDQVHTALAAAVTFRTFTSEVFNPTLKEKTKLDIGAHIGIDQKTVLVRKLGLKQVDGRSDRQNEVWAGKPVNMASKLASISGEGHVLVSDRYFHNLTDDHALLSCGCVDDGTYLGTRARLWSELKVVEITDKQMFDFDVVYRLNNRWCPNHGDEFCQAILKADR